MTEHHAQFLQHNSKQRNKFLLLRLRDALLEVCQQLAKRNDEIIEDMGRLGIGQFIASLQHACVHLDDFLLDHSHVTDCHEVQNVFAVDADTGVHLA